MRCLCCGRELGAVGLGGWHKGCVRRFFGTTVLPLIALDAAALTALAAQTVEKGYTVTGVQKKLSLHLSCAGTPRLTLVNYPAGYILKPQVKSYPHMPEAEHLVMSMAEAAGITTVPHALINRGSEVAYITKRVDRTAGMEKLAMEDFCQLDLKLTEQKYMGSYERCAKLIGRYSDAPGLDAAELFMRLVFCFLTGNSDMHLKNFSLLQTNGAYRLSPAYDLLPVQLLTEDAEDTALALNGKKQHLRRKDFIAFARTAGIPQKAASAMLERMLSRAPEWSALCGESLLPENMRTALTELINERVRRLTA